MGYTLSFEHPHFPPGEVFSVNMLGAVENGSSLEVDEEHERLFLATNGRTVEDAFKGNPFVTLRGASTLSSDDVKEMLPAEESNEDSEPPVQDEEVNDNA